MNDPSLLFAREESCPEAEGAAAPDYFRDLNLDQIIEAVAAAYEEYDLKPFFHRCLHTPDAITYRQEVFRDLQEGTTHNAVTTFAKSMRAMRGRLERERKWYYKLQKQACLLEAVKAYCAALDELRGALRSAPLQSQGFWSMRGYIARHIETERFKSLKKDTDAVAAALAGVKYRMLIRPGSVQVSRDDDESDYSSEVSAAFAKFEGPDAAYPAAAPAGEEMNHVEAAVLDQVAKLFPEPFAALEAYCAEHADYVDPVIARYDREVHFYIAYLEYKKTMEQTGLPFCFPRMNEAGKDVYSQDVFDLALAKNLTAQKQLVVLNDFRLEGRERIIVVSGPNQGGKTTFARVFGQLHHLASLGCPVPGTAARLLLFDRLFTHFEREERMDSLRGKLEDDLLRVRRIVDQATGRSVVILNEIFTSTSLRDAVFLSRKFMRKLVDLDVLGVWVTFLDELSTFGEEAVSMMSSVAPDRPAVRTFKIIRRPADGLAYALSIAEKYGLTHERLKERLRR